MWFWLISCLIKPSLLNLNPTAHPFNADLGLPINIGGVTLPMTYLWMLVTGFTVAGALYFFLNKTKMGLGVRAVALKGNFQPS